MCSRQIPPLTGQPAPESVVRAVAAVDPAVNTPGNPARNTPVDTVANTASVGPETARRPADAGRTIRRTAQTEVVSDGGLPPVVAVDLVSADVNGGDTPVRSCNPDRPDSPVVVAEARADPVAEVVVVVVEARAEVVPAEVVLADAAVDAETSGVVGGSSADAASADASDVVAIVTVVVKDAAATHQTGVVAAGDDAGVVALSAS